MLGLLCLVAELRTHRTSFSFSTTSLAEISVSAVHAADSVKSSDATIGDAVDDPVIEPISILLLRGQLSQQAEFVKVC